MKIEEINIELMVTETGIDTEVVKTVFEEGYSLAYDRGRGFFKAENIDAALILMKYTFKKHGKGLELDDSYATPILIRLVAETYYKKVLLC